MKRAFRSTFVPNAKNNKSIDVWNRRLPDKSSAIEWRYLPNRTLPSYWRCSWRCRPKIGNCHVRPTMPSNWAKQTPPPYRRVRSQWSMVRRKSLNPTMAQSSCRSENQSPTACPTVCRMFSDHRRQSSSTTPNQSIRMRTADRPQRCQTDAQWHQRPRTVWSPLGMHTLAPNGVAHVARYFRKKTHKK